MLSQLQSQITAQLHIAKYYVFDKTHNH